MARFDTKPDCLRTPFLRDQAFCSSMQFNYPETSSKEFLHKVVVDTSIYYVSIMI